jgi:glycosyltransferase involved in cell wall biosynthesis
MSGANVAPLRILVTVAWGRRLGGAEIFLWTWLRNLDRAASDPLVVFFERGPFVDEVTAMGFRTMVVRTGRLRNVAAFLFAIVRLAGLLRRNHPDVILNWSAKTHLYGGLAAMLMGMSGRVMWWQHGIADHHWLHRMATYIPAHTVATPSAAAARAQQMMRPRRKTTVIYPGVDSPSPQTEALRAELRAGLGVPSDVPLVGIVGRLEPWKGQDRFVRMIAELLSKREVRGLIVGGNAYDLFPMYEKQVLNLIIELGLCQAITTTGQTDQVAKYLGAMDVLVSASTAEPFGIVIVEALALGVPVVAVDEAGPSEILAGDGGGILVAGGDPTSLATAVGRLLSDAEWRTRLSAAGRRRFHERFTAVQMARRMQAALESVQPFADSDTSMGPT